MPSSFPIRDVFCWPVTEQRIELGQHTQRPHRHPCRGPAVKLKSSCGSCRLLKRGLCPIPHPPNPRCCRLSKVSQTVTLRPHETTTTSDALRAAALSLFGQYQCQCHQLPYVTWPSSFSARRNGSQDQELTASKQIWSEECSNLIHRILATVSRG